MHLPMRMYEGESFSGETSRKVVWNYKVSGNYLHKKVNKL